MAPTSSTPPWRSPPRSTWRPAARRCRPASTASTRACSCRALKPKALAKLERFPGLFDRERLLAANDLYAFDNVVTAPLHGFRDTDDYWHRASAKHVLDDITVPTLVLNARNDPFLPGRHLPARRRPRSRWNIPATGGHVGFADRPLPRPPRLAAAAHAALLRQRGRQGGQRRARAPAGMPSLSPWMISSNKPWPSGRTCPTATAGWPWTRAAPGACATKRPSAPARPATG